MSRGHANLGGHWHGLFNYPIAFPSTAFEATIQDLDGGLAGTTSEVDHTGAVVTATINGRREGSSVRFAKMYDDANAHRDFVHYEGTLHTDGNEIEGKWTIPGDWSGTFLMIRGAGSETVERLSVETPVEVRR